MSAETWSDADSLALAAYTDGAGGSWASDDWSRSQVNDYARWWDLGAIEATYWGESDLLDLPGEVPPLPGQVTE